MIPDVLAKRKLLGERKLAPLSEQDKEALLAVLLVASRERGVEWRHIEDALGPGAAKEYRGEILGILEYADVRVETPFRSLADSPLSGMLPDLVQALGRKGIATWRDLFTAEEGVLLAPDSFPPEDADKIRDAVRRTGYKLGMTSEEVDRRAVLLSDLFAIPVLRLGLNVRPENALYNFHAATLGDLCALTDYDLLSFRNFGKRSLSEVKDALTKYGLFLGMIVPGYGVSR